MLKKYSVRFLFLIVGLMLGLVMGRVGTMPASANPNSQQPAEICDDNRGNPLNCLLLLEQQNSERLIAMQEALNRQETSLTTINSNVTDLASANANSAEATLQALNRLDAGLTEMNQSFSLRYLLLQQDIQAQTREFTLLSNLVKTRIDAIREAIENID